MNTHDSNSIISLPSGYRFICRYFSNWINAIRSYLGFARLLLNGILRSGNQLSERCRALSVLKTACMACCVILALPHAASAQGSWNISLGYSATNNPNAPWSYGRKATVANLTMDLFTVPWGSSGWYLGNVGNGGPSVQAGPIMWAKANGNGYPCGRWTCPKTGKYDIQGKFTGSDPRGVDNFVYVVINGSVRFSSRVQADQQSAPFAIRQVSLNVGDFVDFTLVWGGAVFSEYGWTDVDAVISRVPASDLNGDGNADLVFQNSATGKVYAWFLDGTGAPIDFSKGSGIKSTGYLYDGNLVGWHLAGIADVNGDGIPDLVFQNADTGQVYAFFLDGSGAKVDFGTGSGLKGSGYLYGGSLVGWKLAGIGDVNNDGIPDLVFQNETTGQLHAWLLDGTGASINFTTHAGFKSTGYLYGGSLIGWRLAGIADVNNDGIPDLVFQNTGTGQIYAWMLDGTGASINFSPATGIKSTGYLYGGSLPGWQLTGISDVNGDGIPDLIFQNEATGQVYAWFLDGTGASINFSPITGIKSTGFLYDGNLTGWELH